MTGLPCAGPTLSCYTVQSSNDTTDRYHKPLPAFSRIGVCVVPRDGILQATFHGTSDLEAAFPHEKEPFHRFLCKSTTSKQAFRTACSVGLVWFEDNFRLFGLGQSAQDRNP